MRNAQKVGQAPAFSVQFKHQGVKRWLKNLLNFAMGKRYFLQNSIDFDTVQGHQMLSGACGKVPQILSAMAMLVFLAGTARTGVIPANFLAASDDRGSFGP